MSDQPSAQTLAAQAWDQIAEEFRKSVAGKVTLTDTQFRAFRMSIRLWGERQAALRMSQGREQAGKERHHFEKAFRKLVPVPVSTSRGDLPGMCPDCGDDSDPWESINGTIQCMYCGHACPTQHSVRSE